MDTPPFSEETVEEEYQQKFEIFADDKLKVLIPLIEEKFSLKNASDIVKKEIFTFGWRRYPLNQTYKGVLQCLRGTNHPVEFIDQKLDEFMKAFTCQQMEEMTNEQFRELKNLFNKWSNDMNSFIEEARPLGLSTQVTKLFYHTAKTGGLQKRKRQDDEEDDEVNKKVKRAATESNKNDASNASSSSAEQQPARRGRGRPRKIVVEEETSSEDEDAEEIPKEQPVRRKRGRPRKDANKIATTSENL